MDDSMTGPAAGVLGRLSDFDGEQSALFALRAGMTTGWHVRGDRGDAAVRVGKAKVFVTNGKNANSKENGGTKHDEANKEARLLSLDAERWMLCKGASFAAGNSVFNVEEVNELKQKVTIHCSKGPMRGKLIDIHAARCPFVFGRAHEADLCIMDRELSRKHGAIVYLPNGTGGPGGSKNKKGGVFILTDLESTVSQVHVQSTVLYCSDEMSCDLMSCVVFVCLEIEDLKCVSCVYRECVSYAYAYAYNMGMN
jgi:hypothetical protein